jgi:hypothetical protein
MDSRTQDAQRSRRRWIATLAVAGCCVVLFGIVLVLQFSGAAAPEAAVGSSRDAMTGAALPAAERQAQKAPGRPAVELPESSPVDPATARKIAVEYNKGKFNAFFDGKAFLANAMAKGTLSVKALTDQLLSTRELEALPANVRVLTDKPAAVLERMAMIDTLEALAEDDRTALDALVEVGSAPVGGGLAAQVKRAVVAERYDVFTALARKNWDVTRTAFLGLQNPALMEIVRPALIGGLVDTGVSRAKAVSTVEAL